MEKIKELDLVVSIVSVTEVPVGTKGTVVHNYDDKTFEVEFFKDNKTITVATVLKSQIEKMKHKKPEKKQEKKTDISSYPVKAQYKLIKDMPDFTRVWYHATTFEEFKTWLDTKVIFSPEVIKILQDKFDA
jgi:hypothetical protein